MTTLSALPTGLDATTRFRHDPYPWADKPIAFGGGPHGLQACRFSIAEKRQSISGREKWLLKTDRPVLRHVLAQEGLSAESKALHKLVKLHYTRLVWADECLPERQVFQWAFLEQTGADFAHYNGSVIEIPDQWFTHIRRADFVKGNCVLDRHVFMSLLYVDDDQPEFPVVKRFVIRPGVAFGHSVQGVTMMQRIPYCMIRGRFDFTDDRYCSPTGLFKRTAAGALNLGSVRL